MVLKAVCSSSRCCSLRCRATSRTLVGSAPLYSVTGLTGMKISVDDWLYLSGVRRVCSGTSLAGKLGVLGLYAPWKSVCSVYSAATLVCYWCSGKLGWRISLR